MTGAPPAPLAKSGTPKKGVSCIECDDWGTVVIGPTKESVREVPCPSGCAAAERVLQQDGRVWA